MYILVSLKVRCGLLVLFLQRVVVSAAAAVKLLQQCPTLCDPIDGSLHPPVSAVPGILQARILEFGLPFPSPVHESEK